jgi:hypothetical protein
LLGRTIKCLPFFPCFGLKAQPPLGALRFGYFVCGFG